MVSTTWENLREALRGKIRTQDWYRLAHWGFVFSKNGQPNYTYAQWKAEDCRLQGMDWEGAFSDFEVRLLCACVGSPRRRRGAV